MTDSSNTDSADVEEPLAIRVLAGNPNASELAAVTAVLTALTDDDGKRMPAAPAARSAWSLSQRQLRTAIAPGPGAWGRQRF